MFLKEVIDVLSYELICFFLLLLFLRHDLAEKIALISAW